jgi:hypothetical protein
LKWIGGVVVVYIAIAFWATTNSLFSGHIAIGIILLASFVTTLVSVFRPLPFDLQVFGGTVDYKFRNREYAKHFLELNQDAVTETEFRSRFTKSVESEVHSSVE